ncbi:DUF6894 family protein [Sphingopyxis fribergensis]
MPHYYFNTTNGSPHVDDAGMDLPDIYAARREAIRYGGSLLSDDPEMVMHDNGLCIDVVDEAGSRCFAVRVVIER